jgi:hypothetical protein
MQRHAVDPGTEPTEAAKYDQHALASRSGCENPPRSIRAAQPLNFRTSSVGASVGPIRTNTCTGSGMTSLPTIRQPRSAALCSNSSSSRRATRPPRIRRLYFRHHTTCSPHRAHRAACAAKPALRHATNVTKRHRQSRDHTLFTSPDPPTARSRRSLGAHSMHRMICACDDPVGAAPSRGDAAMWGSPTSGRYPHPLAMRRSGAID